eukprot:TRINITY_DN12766_c0_g3_i1.p1 TRINITY_DN12766_c0_g3~~TRINITY_DN12766_c0_g3_i1.p1  ORF type:complete len:624 (-),score=142.28 TRINITY_DN12766_c0_g3_i1:100-1971(-)
MPPPQKNGNGLSGRGETSFAQLLVNLSAERAGVEEELRRLRFENDVLRQSVNPQVTLKDSKTLDFMGPNPHPRMPFNPTTNIAKLDHPFTDTTGLAAPEPCTDAFAPRPPDDTGVVHFGASNGHMDKKGSLALRHHSDGTDGFSPPRTPPLSRSTSVQHGRKSVHTNKNEMKKLVHAYEGKDMLETAGADRKSLRHKMLAGDELVFVPEAGDRDVSVTKRVTTTFTNLSAPGDSPSRAAALRMLKWWPFDAVVAFVVVLDFVVLGLTVQNSLHPSGRPTEDFILHVLDRSCTVFYVVELSIRFYGCGWRFCLKNGFIRLDCVLVACAVLELVMTTILNNMKEGNEIIGKLSVLRILRVARIGRAARLTVHLRTLWLLISGLHHSASTIFWTFIMITGITYAFALLGMEMLPPDDLDMSTLFNEVAVLHFGDLVQAMLTLLQVLTLDSIAGIYRPLITEADGAWMRLVVALYFILYILFVSIALMNLVTAVMVEGAMQQASEDREFIEKMEEEKKKKMLPELKDMFQLIDADGSGQVSLEELIEAPEELKNRLKEITGSGSPVEIFQLIDEDESNSLMVDEFLDGLLKCANGTGIQQFQMERLVRQVGRLKQVCVDDQGYAAYL